MSFQRLLTRQCLQALKLVKNIKEQNSLKVKMTLWGVFPILNNRTLKVAPARPLFQDRIETCCLKEVSSFREENFPLFHPEVRWKNQNRKAANKKVTSAMMQNQERRQRRLSDLSTGTGNTNKTSSSQHAENSTTSGVKRRSAKSTSDVTFHGRCDSRRTIQQFNKQLESIP